MTAVSQSYPNYLGGLNEQPDELKKPGQLVEAINVIPDPVLGLTRRPGFELINTLDDAQTVGPAGTWFEVSLPNQINTDYMYYGCVNNLNGRVNIYNQDGEKQVVRYTDVSIEPHQDYLYNDNELIVTDDNGNETKIPLEIGAAVVNYFEHETYNPLKYCISKNHIIFTNPERVPALDGTTKPTAAQKSKYYSYVNLNVLDTANYDYVFKLFFDGSDTYRYITDISLENIVDIDADYDKDTSLPLQVKGPFLFPITPKDGGEDAVVEVTFRGQVVQLKSSDGDGFRNEARYSWSTRLITPGKGFKKGEVYREVLSAADAGGETSLTFTFKIDDVNTVKATVNDSILPTPSPDVPVTDQTLSQILINLGENFKESLNTRGGNAKVVVTGSGIYLEAGIPFAVSTAEVAVADVLNSQKIGNDVVPIVRVNTTAELPVECFAGFIVEVINSFNDDNNYYLEYVAESQSSDLDLTKSDGYWEEIAKPYERYNPENGTLPHMVTVARESDKTEFVFIVSPMQYKKRTAGTAETNPSFFDDGAPITALNYYKNRLFFFTKNGTVFGSKVGEINNLFINTGVRTSTVDPIDLTANSNQRVPIYGSAVVNNGMVLFGESEQYSMTTANDVLTSQTASITKISNYTFNRVSDPVYLGSNLAFISSGVPRLFEMTNVYDRGPVDINERSQQISILFSQGYNQIASSREQSQLIAYKKYQGDNTASPDMLLYRFRQENSQDSSQTSWVQWRLGSDDKFNPDSVYYISMPRDKMFVFVNTPDGIQMYRMDGSSLEGLPADGTKPVPEFSDGYSSLVTGKPFETRITFPTIYPRGKESYDITADTTIHRVKLSTALVGTYRVQIERLGYDPYEILIEQTPSDSYKTLYPTLSGKRIEDIPIYTRNKNLTLTLTTEFNAPFTLNSMTWEGDWNPPYYKRA